MNIQTVNEALSPDSPISTSSEKLRGSPTLAGGVIVTDVAPVPIITCSLKGYNLYQAQGY